MKLIPTVLTRDPEKARELISKIIRSGKFERIQVDFIDGEYVDNETIRPEQLQLAGMAKIKLDAHLMVKQQNIRSYVEALKRLKFDRIIPQAEEAGGSLGNFRNLAIDLATPLESLEPGIFENKDLILLMGVRAGWGGQKMDEAIWGKVAGLNKVRREMGESFRIGIDGGVLPENLENLKLGGVDEACVGGERLLGWPDNLTG